MRLFTPIFSFLMFVQIFAVESKEDWKRVYLASYPRSGNHWTRNLLEETTHVATGSVYLDKEPPHLKKPFPWGGYAPKNGCEGNCRYPEKGEIVVIKTHFPAHIKTQFDLQPATKLIRIVRHPIDAFYSQFFHRNPDHQLTADGKIPSWFVKRSIGRWKKFQKYWNQQPNVLTIRYEDLLTQPHVYLREIVEASGYQVSEEDINRAVSKFPPHDGGALKHLNDYDSKDLALISQELGPLMKKHHYTINQ